MFKLKSGWFWGPVLGITWAGLLHGQDPCVFRFPTVDQERSLDEDAYITTSSLVLKYAKGRTEPRGRGLSIVGLRREFVDCFSGMVQHAAADGVSWAQDLVGDAELVGLKTHVSGWGFDYEEETEALLDRLDELLARNSPFSNLAREQCGSPDARFFFLTSRRKIDPSIEPSDQVEVLVTMSQKRFCPPDDPASELSFDEAGQARIWLQGKEAICTLAKSSCVRAIERFPVIELRGHHLAAADPSPPLTPCSSPPEKFLFDGGGQVAGIIDQPLDLSHCSFFDLVPVGGNHRKVVFDGGAGEPGPPVEERFHGTIVASLLAGAPPNSDPALRGAAPKAKFAFSPLATPFDSKRIENDLSLEYSEKARVFSISWGDSQCKPVGKSCRLGALSRLFDRFGARHEEALVIAAVSNGNYIALPENGRNVLGVAASGGAGRECNLFRGAGGPGVDGQWKPELLSQGCRVRAAVPGTNCSGDFAPPAIDPMTRMAFPNDCATSWAAPNLAGAALQLRQYLSLGCYLSAGCQLTEVCRPSAAQMKALLVAGGTLPKGVDPGASTGWGLPNLGRVAKRGGPIFLVDVFNSPADRLDLKYDLTRIRPWVGPYSVFLDPNVATGTEVTLAWTDPSYGPAVGRLIPPDLDLIVVAKKGGNPLGVFVGNWANRLADWVELDSKRDRINLIERVSIPNCWKADRLEVYVYARKVVPFSLITAFQGYSLSVTGAVAAAGVGHRSQMCETADPQVPSMVEPLLPFVPGPSC